MMTYEYSVRNHGDLLERTECEFIESQLPAYEEIWKCFIGHQGNGRMAEIKNISEALNEKRVRFAQHHYTVLESLVLMREIVDAPLLSNPVHTIKEYYKVLNLIMSFQAHAGRVQDNMKACLKAIAKGSSWDTYRKKLTDIYSNRNIFLHGRKVPFMLDKDNLFNIATPKNYPKGSYGCKQGANWESIPYSTMRLAHRELQSDFKEVLIITNQFLDELNIFVSDIINENNLQITNAPDNAHHQIQSLQSIDIQKEYMNFPTASGSMPNSDNPTFDPES
jgi:hypothetical protein